MSTKKYDEPSPPARELEVVPVDFAALDDAIQSGGYDTSQYLHLRTGAVVVLRRGVTALETLEAFARSPSHVWIQPVSPQGQHRWMQDFILEIADPELVDRLTRAINGRSPFRRFKDVLGEHPDARRAWFAFHEQRVREAVEAWLLSRGLAGVPAEPPPRAHLEGGAAAESTRARLDELTDSLAADDADVLLAVAEFFESRARAAGA